ncbi:MAG: hypothetical protein AAFR73_01705 [Pseudomonadota bacterium]
MRSAVRKRGREPRNKATAETAATNVQAFQSLPLRKVVGREPHILATTVFQASQSNAKKAQGDVSPGKMSHTMQSAIAIPYWLFRVTDFWFQFWNAMAT